MRKLYEVWIAVGSIYQSNPLHTVQRLEMEIRSEEMLGAEPLPCIPLFDRYLKWLAWVASTRSPATRLHQPWSVWLLFYTPGTAPLWQPREREDLQTAAAGIAPGHLVPQCTVSAHSPALCFRTLEIVADLSCSLTSWTTNMTNIFLTIILVLSFWEDPKLYLWLLV